MRAISCFSALKKGSPTALSATNKSSFFCMLLFFQSCTHQFIVQLIFTPEWKIISKNTSNMNRQLNNNLHANFSFTL